MRASRLLKNRGSLLIARWCFWRQAVRNEVDTLNCKEAWIPEKVPADAKVLDSKFVFVLKRKADGTIDK